MRVLYVATSFPAYSETFIQREVRALLQHGVELEIVSLHGGSDSFEGHPVRRFRKWELLRLVYRLPLAVWQHAERLQPLAREMTTRCPASPLNLLENLLGMACALIWTPWIRSAQVDVVHGVWAGGPAAFAWIAAVIAGRPYSTGAHAYDVFEHGGDWLLEPKLQRAVLVQVSTDSARRRIRRLCDPDKVAFARRGLGSLPRFRAPRGSWDCLRILCVARLVEKKGLLLQLAIYKELQLAGLPFRAKIVGEGPMKRRLLMEILRLGLQEEVELTGRLSQEEVGMQMRWADMLFHTGIVAASGDRDGLPNVLPEAMAHGALVLGSPVSGVVEAIDEGKTGFLVPANHPSAWKNRILALREDGALRKRVAMSARSWVESNFDAHRNTGALLERLARVLAR